MTVRNIINAALIKFYTKLNKKVLKTVEEIEANTDESNIAGATAVAELSNNLTAQMGGLSFYEDTEGNKYAVGADAVPKKLGNSELYFPAIYLSAAGSGYSHEEAAGAQSYGSASSYFELNTQNYNSLYLTSGSCTMVGTYSNGTTTSTTISAGGTYNISNYNKIRLVLNTSASKVTSSGWAEAKWNISKVLYGLKIS